MAFSKAFECQLRKVIGEPFARRPNPPIGLREIHRWLAEGNREFVDFLTEQGFDPRRLQLKVSKVVSVRKRVAHEANVSREEAHNFRNEWLGVHPRGPSIFAAAVPIKATVSSDARAFSRNIVKIDPEKHEMPGRPPIA